MPRRPSFRGVAVVLTALVDGLGLDLVAVEGLAREDDVWRTFEKALVHILTGGTERGS